MKTGRGGVKFEDVVVGDGPCAVRGCAVEIRYDLLLNRGERVQKDQISSFRLGDRSSIAGLEYGIEGMRQGGVRRVRVGPHLAYGRQGVPGVVPPDAVLEFHVSLLRVDPEESERHANGSDPGAPTMKVCVVGASGKLGQYMVQHALDRGYEVVGVCRERSVEKLDAFKGRITIIPGATDDREVIKDAVAGCDGVLTVLVPWGMHQYSSGTAQAVLDFARPGARLVFSCGWHITRDGRDVYSRRFRWTVAAFGWFARLVRVADLSDQVEASRRVFDSDTRWTVVRGSDLEEGESQGLPVWSLHVGDPILESNITRRVDFALFMVEALANDELIHEAPAIVGCRAPSALAFKTVV